MKRATTFFQIALCVLAIASTIVLPTQDADAQLRVQRTLLSTPTQVTFIGATQPEVSPLGDVLCAVHFGSLVLFDLGGMPLDTLAFGTTPSWSPDGGKVAFRSGGVSVVDIATGQQQFLCPGTCNVNNGLAWSPLGNEIVYQDADEGPLVVSYPAGLVSNIPCNDPTGDSCEGEWPTWSPDGQWIAFEDGAEILKVSRSGGLADTVVATLGDVTNPAWSPDGKWIAFSLEEFDPGGFEFYRHIWVANANGFELGVAQITDGMVSDFRPAWSPDSRTIYFGSNRSGQAEVWKVEFDPMVPTQVTTWSRVKAERR